MCVVGGKTHARTPVKGDCPPNLGSFWKWKVCPIRGSSNDLSIERMWDIETGIDKNESDRQLRVAAEVARVKWWTAVMSR
jgi:hypothetical protein